MNEKAKNFILLLEVLTRYEMSTHRATTDVVDPVCIAERISRWIRFSVVLKDVFMLYSCQMRTSAMRMSNSGCRFSSNQ